MPCVHPIGLQGGGYFHYVHAYCIVFILNKCVLYLHVYILLILGGVIDTDEIPDIMLRNVFAEAR